jgi:hypothetical protein
MHDLRRLFAAEYCRLENSRWFVFVGELNAQNSCSVSVRVTDAEGLFAEPNFLSVPLKAIFVCAVFQPLKILIPRLRYLVSAFYALFVLDDLVAHNAMVVHGPVLQGESDCVVVVVVVVVVVAAAAVVLW